MCGIVGYIGKQQAYPVLIDGLRRLEYRGYDSAGVAVSGKDGVQVLKRAGKVEALDQAAKKHDVTGTIGIGHTRWATHGEANETNAHPHTSHDGRIVLVHNGIIENYNDLRSEMVGEGVELASETDTEVLANVVAQEMSREEDLFKAVQAALKRIRGAYAIAVMDTKDPDSLVLAKKSSPLAIGIAEDGFVVGSDATPIISHTHKVIYLEDDEVAILHRGGDYSIESMVNGAVTPAVQELDMNVDALEKAGYDHFMLKEINEQPQVLRETMRGRLRLDKQTVMLGGIADHERRILRAPKLTIVACGTSWHAGMVGKYLIEELARIPVEVDVASEFRYRNPVLTSNDVVLAISQSGETADTLAAVKLANSAGALTLGLVNVVGSSIARATTAGVYTHAGPEVSVASTKAFGTQVVGLTLMALRLAQQLGTLSVSELHQRYEEFAQVPDWIEEAIETESKMKEIAKYVAGQSTVLYLGRGTGFPVALEGALKLKELSYLPAEGFAAGEMKHGPIALIEKGTPVIAVVPTEPEMREKMISNIEEVRARGGYVIALSPEDEDIKRLAHEAVWIPPMPALFSAAVATVPLQFLAYHVTLLQGKDVDKPRNLAKSVTVE